MASTMVEMSHKGSACGIGTQADLELLALRVTFVEDSYFVRQGDDLLDECELGRLYGLRRHGIPNLG